MNDINTIPVQIVNIEKVSTLNTQYRAAQARVRELQAALRDEEKRVAVELLSSTAKVGDRVIARELNTRTGELEHMLFEVIDHWGWFDQDDEIVEARFQTKRVLRSGKLSAEDTSLELKDIIKVLDGAKEMPAIKVKATTTRQDA